ncbi:hypothetical protein HPULCUR_009155 [Helicostylum pulchrum]|uniref:Uncharacterized protein n=1 Tax=Helicostylum pulchrum TaxID=562976 RepID=A0ABP9Y9M9_9FUNG
MLAVNNTIRFASYFRGKKKLERDNSSLIELLARAEDDEKLQSNLDLMLLSLTSDERDRERKEAEVSLKEALYGLIEQIQKATKRTLDNQTANPSARLQRELDISSLGVLIDRMNKRRLVDQEWVSNSEQLKRDINELVAKSASLFATDNQFDEQRFELSPIKERDLYLFQIFSKIDRQTSRRMSNQDAKPRRNFEDDELFSLINKMQQSSGFNNQRASLRHRA